jgi:hypothetical protein
VLVRNGVRAVAQPAGALGERQGGPFVLHDMFALPFDDIAPIVNRTPAACAACT